ncbi:DMSO/selenate family reductase complex A subunit [Aggregatilinea lenta]|uniref:DMSO/selenate family reductase complex A subunit n=1 Tax=Aggregatilinea lenta TaxID=913108 RepID=UPI001EE831A8|nr:DMSO/selenate family reductase complex A subunit [Aggregatilinea lenta]
MGQNQMLSKILDDAVLTRRSFVKWSSALGGTAALAGGLGTALHSTQTAEASRTAEGASQLVTTACYHNCGGRCILYADVQDGVVKRLVPDIDEVDTIDQPRSIPCLRGRAQIHRVYSTERLKYPMKRVGKRGEGKFERISWEEALDTIASEMTRLKETYGNESFYFHYASGTQWPGPNGRNPVRRLMRLFGGYTDYYGTYSSACYSAVIPLITGGANNSADDMLNSKLVVLFSSNPVVTTSGGDNVGYHCMKAKEAGARFICIDPIMTDSCAALEAEWVPINPGTDVALVAALSHVMIKNDLYDKEFMAKYSVGFDEDTLPEDAPKNSSWMAYVMGDADDVEKTPEWAAEITGIPAERIVSLAYDMAQTKPCAIVQNLGFQRRAYGEQPVRAIPILAAMTGNFGIHGGGTGATVGRGSSISMGSVPTGDNPIKGVISVFMWPDMITRGTEMTSGPDDRIKGVEKLNANMKFMWNHGGNTITNQHSDINLTQEILSDDTKLELIVTCEVMMTPSAMWSDILLPACTGFETDNVITGGGSGRVAWAMYSHQVIEPLFEDMPEIWMADQLADRLGVLDAFREGKETTEDWIRFMVDTAREKDENFPTFEEFKEVGIYKKTTSGQVIGAADFVEDPEANPLSTPTGKIEIYSPTLAALNDPEEIPAIPKYIPEWEGVSDPLRDTYPLMMIGSHAVQRSHSTFSGIDYLEEAHHHVMWINTLDAADRGIENGDTVHVFNDRGKIEIEARVTPRIRPGVISVPQGHWYDPDSNGLDKGGCINTLTKYHPTPFAKGNPQHTNLVQVEKA